MAGFKVITEEISVLAAINFEIVWGENGAFSINVVIRQSIGFCRFAASWAVYEASRGGLMRQSLLLKGGTVNGYPLVNHFHSQAAGVDLSVMEPDLDDTMRKHYRDTILKIDKKRSAYEPDSDYYKALSRVIEECQRSLAYLRSKEPQWKHTGSDWEAT